MSSTKRIYNYNSPTENHKKMYKKSYIVIEETVHDIDDKIIKNDIEDLLVDSENELESTNKELNEIKKILTIIYLQVNSNL